MLGKWRPALADWLNNQNLYKVLYTLNGAFSKNGGTIIFLYWYLSGVLQGCPASAFIFDVSIDPLLEAFEEAIGQQNRGIVKVCADDIGMALSSFKYLRHIAPIFQTIAKTAGLCLKPPKCVVIPTSEPCTDELVKYIKTWLASNIPEWSNFSIKPVGN